MALWCYSMVYATASKNQDIYITVSEIYLLNRKCLVVETSHYKDVGAFPHNG